MLSTTALHMSDYVIPTTTQSLRIVLSRLKPITNEAMTTEDCRPSQVKKQTTRLIRVFLRAELQITRSFCREAGSKRAEVGVV